MAESSVAAIEPDTTSAVPAPEPLNVPAPITPMQMLQIAIEKGADLDQLTKLMDLQERWEASEARKAFVSAKAAFSAELPQIVKNKEVTFGGGGRGTSYHHATLDNVAAVLSPLLGKHGLAYSWEMEQLDGGLIKVTCVLTHQLGHSEHVSLQAGPDTSGSKNGIQAVGSTVTYLERYTLLAVTGAATKEQDDDGFDGGLAAKITEAQKETLVNLQMESGADTAKFLAYLGIESLDDLPAKDFERAEKMLRKKIADNKTKESADG